MNLLGHLACAAHLPPEVQAGALLPDLLGLHGRRLKSLPLVARWKRLEPGMAQAEPLVRGIAQHHEVDGHFHRAPLFTECARRLRERLLEASASPGLKRLLPAHVLTELYLDHLLLVEAPQWGPRFDAVLHGQREVLSQFAALHPEVRAEDFAALLQRLVAGGFIAGYRTPQGLMERMQRILVRLGQRALERGEQAAVLEELASQAAPLRERLHEFIAWAAVEFAGSGRARGPLATTAGLSGGTVADTLFASGQIGPVPGTLHPLGCSPGSGTPLAVMES